MGEGVEEVGEEQGSEKAWPSKDQSILSLFTTNNLCNGIAANMGGDRFLCNKSVGQHPVVWKSRCKSPPPPSWNAEYVTRNSENSRMFCKQNAIRRVARLLKGQCHQMNNFLNKKISTFCIGVDGF